MLKVCRDKLLSTTANGLAASIGQRRFRMNKTRDESLLVSLKYFLQHRTLQLKSAMVERKRIVIRMPGFREPCYINYNLSDLCGHGSFVLLALSYLESDFLSLRVYAMSGVSLSILFQYYREKPLWIPIGWNSLFFLINAIMIGYLIKDNLAAQRMSIEEKEIYHRLFEKKGLAPGDFVRLISKAKREVIPKGEKLVDETKRNTRVYLLKEGDVSIRKGGSEVGRISGPAFVGAMSFLTWDSEQDAAKVQQSLMHGSFSTLFASNDYVETPRKVDPSASSSGSPSSSDQHSGSNAENSDVISSTFWWPTSWTVGYLFSSTDGSQEGPNFDPSAVRVDDGHNGHADAVCEAHCVVYYWRFKDLRRLKEQSPSLGLILERCISEDLNKKMNSTWSKEVHERYKQLLLGALSDGQLTEAVKGLLQSCRQRLKVNDELHDCLVQELGWTLEEYRTGFKGVSEDILEEYEHRLGEELHRPGGLTEMGRARLRTFRQQHQLSAAAHLHVLSKLGWTMDEYEAINSQPSPAMENNNINNSAPPSTQEGWIPSRPVLRYLYRTFLRPFPSTAISNYYQPAATVAVKRRSIESVSNFEPEI